MKELVTTSVISRKYKVIATQRLEGGVLESGFSYAIFKGDHIVGTGSVMFGGYSKGIPSQDLLKILNSKREEIQDDQ